MWRWLRGFFSKIRSTAQSLWKRLFPAESAHSLLSATSFLILILILFAAVALVAASLEHRWNYKQQIIISDFLVTAQGSPTDKKSSEISAFGREASDLFASDLNNVIQEGSGFSTSTAGRAKYVQPFDGVPKVPVSKSYGIEIQGISIDQLIKAWDGIRYDQQLISGDVLPDSGPPDRYVLKISIRSERQDQQLTSSPFLLSNQELDSAIEALAEKYVAINNPEIAGRYYLAGYRYAEAINIFTEWMKNEPKSPEPRLYLAKALILDGQFDRAGQFVESARVRLDADVRGTSANRKRLQDEIDLADGTARWGAGDITGAEKLFTGPLKGQANALNNLGTLYLGKQRYQEAETVLEQAYALNGQNYRAALLLGETYSAGKNYAEAERWFSKAMEIRPTWTQGAEEYLESMEAAHDEAGAMQYCHSWVGTKVGSVAIVTDAKSDLYELCAQAELSKSNGNPSQDAVNSTLAWYYALALSRSDSDRMAILQDQTYKMPDVLCHVKSDRIGQWDPPVDAAGEKLLADGRTKLLEKLRKYAKDPNNRQAAASIKKCESSANGQ